MTVVASGAVLASALLVACILADPPAELPTAPPNRPAILHQLVVPPPTRVLTEWPDLNPLEVPVEIDANASFSMSAFVDYDPVTNFSPYGPSTTIPPVQVDGGIYYMRVGLTAPDLTLCHTIEVVVALSFTGDLHTPVAPGGDSVSWIYSPTGDLATCRVYSLDAGTDAADAAGAEAGADGGSGSGVGVDAGDAGAVSDAAPDARPDGP